MADAADRTVKAASDSRFEDVDISSWLDEADQIDRVRKASDPDTRQLRLDETLAGTIDSGELSVSDTPSKADEEDEESQKRTPTKRPPKSAPGKLPKMAKGLESADSRDAADAALKKFFGGR